MQGAAEMRAAGGCSCSAAATAGTAARCARRPATAPSPRRAAPLRAAGGGATGGEGEAAVLADDLWLTYGGAGSRQRQVAALRGATLSVAPGTLHMLLGPNGCGKSTLMRCCAGTLQPDRGRLRVAAPRGYVCQNPDHQVVMPSAGSDVAFSVGALGEPAPDLTRRVDDALRAVGLEGFGPRPVHSLSGGQKQRVAIAGALVQQPRLLLLDELTTFLDAADQTAVLQAVRELVTGPLRVTALWVTHRLEELAFADAATYMDAGRAVLTTSSEAEMRRHIARSG